VKQKNKNKNAFPKNPKKKNLLGVGNAFPPPLYMFENNKEILISTQAKYIMRRILRARLGACAGRFWAKKLPSTASANVFNMYK
jgi:hypothetical protein